MKSPSLGHSPSSTVAIPEKASRRYRGESRTASTPGFTLYDLADRLAGRGWQVPAYSLEPICEDLVIQRILVRHGVSKDLGALLIEDFKRCIAYFNAHPITSPMTAEEASGFHH
jgi:glutamate decarboxylase